MSSTRQLRELTVETLGTIEGLRSSGLIFINPQQSNSTLHRSYTVNVTTSRNTNKFRDRDLMRLSHTITVTLGHVVRPKDQEDSLHTALDDEDAVILAMLSYNPLERAARVLYTGTNRALSTTGDFIYTTITFDVESSVELRS